MHTMKQALSHINSPAVNALIFDEMCEQGGWEREPVSEWRKWVGDPRNEDDDEAEKKRKEEEQKKKDDEEEKKKKEEEEKKKKEEEDDEVKTSGSELSRLRRIEREHKKAKEDAESAKKKAEEQKKKDEGKYAELVNDAEKERDEARREAEESKKELKTFKFNTRVTSVAKALGFRDPEDAHKFLPDDFDIEGDENDIQRALKKILTAKTYLKDDKKASGNSGGGGGGGGEGNWSYAEIAAMSADEINANWNKPGFQEAVANAKKAA